MVPKSFTEDVRLRFWAKVNKSGECWTWTATKNPDGYGRFYIDGKLCPAHRVAFEMNGLVQPEGFQLDHTCHNPSCVRPDHLRTVTQKQNQENKRGAHANSKSGVRGVFWYPRYNKWVARVGHNGRGIHVGYFDSIKEAEAAVVAKRNQLFTHNDDDRK